MRTLSLPSSVLTVVALSLGLVSCAPKPGAADAVALLDQLSANRIRLQDDHTAISDACPAANEARTELFGEPGLNELPQAYAALEEAVNDLSAACDELSLVAVPATVTAAVADAHNRWQAAAVDELGAMCAPLQRAGQALTHPVNGC